MQRQTKPRVNVFVVILHAGSAVEARITRICKSRRSLRDDRAPLPRIESVQAEAVNVAVLKLHREEWFPSDTDSHRQLRRELPRVVCIKTKEVLIDVDRVRIR